MNATVIAETVRRHVSSAGYIVALILVAMVGLFAAGFNTPGSMWPTLVALLALITGSAVIGPEFSTGALQLIVSKPIRRSVYLLSRVAGVLASVAAAAFLGLVAESAGRLMGGAGVPWTFLVMKCAGTLAASLLAVAMLTLFGSMTRSYFNLAIYLGFEVALNATQAIFGVLRIRGRGFGAFLEQHPSVERGLTLIDDILFASVPSSPEPRWLARVLITVAAALLLACIAFERREVPYGAD